MICSGAFMSMLAFHDRLFADSRIYDLLRAGWNSWYYPKKREVRTANARSSFLKNLQSLFNVSARISSYQGAKHFRSFLQQHYDEKRPLYMSVYGNPIVKGDEITFAKYRPLHFTFVAHGLDMRRDRVFLLSNQLGCARWASIREVESGIQRHNGIIELVVPSSCKFPTRCTIRNFLLDKINGDLIPRSVFYNLRYFVRRLAKSTVYNNGFFDLAPYGAISGPRAMIALARDLSTLFETSTQDVKPYSRQMCRNVLALREQRRIFLGILLDPSLYRGSEIVCQDIESRWRTLEEAWRLVAKSFARVYMSNAKATAAEIQCRLDDIVAKEQRILACIREYLGHIH